MLLYHHTSRKGVEGILRQGRILKGTQVANEGMHVVNSAAVSLTSDPSPLGHGLPDGREITWGVAKKLGGYCEKNGKIYSADHTKYRLHVEIPDDDRCLRPASECHPPEVLIALEMAGYQPFFTLLPVEEQYVYVQDFINVKYPPKGQTWWYYLGDVPAQWIKEIAGRMPDGSYLVATPEDFAQALRDVTEEDHTGS